MVPFGKQQDISRDLSTSSPEDLSGNCREPVYEDGVVVISNEKSASVYELLLLVTYSFVAQMAHCER
jgi:hypothetical protein